MLHSMLKLNRRVIVRIAGCVHVLIPLIVLAATATQALAQTTPDAPSLNRTPPVWWGYAILFLLLVVVLAISLMPSKRSHQD